MPELQQQPSISRTAISGLKWVAVSRLIAQVLTWANTFFVIRLLTPADFGLAALAGVFASFLTFINELGFSITLVQRQVRDDETLRHAFGALLFIGVTLTIGLFLSAPLIGSLVNDVRVVPLVRVVSLQFIAMSFSVIPQAQLSMDMRFRELGLTGVVAAVIGAGTTLTMALHNGGAWSLIIGVLAISVSRTILLNVLCPSPRTPRLQYKKIRHLAGFSGLVLLERTLWYWYTQVDSFVVGRFLGTAQLGLYSVGKQLTNVPLERAMEIINAVAMPAFSRVKSDPIQVKNGYLKLLRVGAGYAFPVFWGLAMVCEPLVRVAIGVRWLAAVPVIQILCISMPLRMLNSLTASPATAVGRQDVNIKSLILAIAVIPLALVFGAKHSLEGAAAAWALGFPFVYLFNATLIRNALGVSLAEMWASIWPPIGAAAFMSLALAAVSRFYLVSLGPLSHLAVALLLGIGLFTAALWLLSPRTAHEVFGLARDVASSRQAKLG